MSEKPAQKKQGWDGFFILLGLGGFLLAVGYGMYLKAAFFPFATVYSIHSADQFNQRKWPEFNFRLPLPSSTLREIRDISGLNALAIPAYSDRAVEETGRAITHFVRNHFKQESGPVLRGFEPILNNPEQEWPGICSEYAKLAVAVAQAMGLAGRVIWLDGHTTSEIYFPGYGWVVVDTNGNLMFENSTGRWGAVADILDSFDSWTPVHLMSEPGNDPDFADLTIRQAYRNNRLAMVIEGARLMDFDLRTREVKSVFRYLASGTPIFRAGQLTSNGRNPVGNLRKATLSVIGLVFVLLFVAVRGLSRDPGPSA